MPFKPGQSGNPGGRKKGEGHVRELARKYTDEAIKTLVELMRCDDKKVRAVAANSLLDRGYGKPAQPIEGELNETRRMVLVFPEPEKKA